MSQGGLFNDPEVVLFISIIAIILVGWGVWFAFHDQFLAVLRFVRLFELEIVNLLTWGDYQEVIEALLPTWLGGPEDPAAAQFTQEKFNVTTDIVVYFFRYPAAVILGACGLYVLLFNKKNKYKKKYDLEGLIGVQAEIWPVISPIVKYNPAKGSARAIGSELPATLPMFAESLTPEEWLGYHGIGLTAEGLPEREAVRKALIAQLGGRWRGVKNLPPHCRALYAAFALKGVQKRNESDDLLGRIAKCWTHTGGLALPMALAQEVDRLIADPNIGGKADEVAKKHAYNITALLGVLDWSRKMGGVLAPATFVWLRGLDRNLWYPLNNLGRRSYHSEAAGAMAHFMAEMMAKKALPMPRVETAVVTFNQYMLNNAVEIPRRAGKKEA